MLAKKAGGKQMANQEHLDLLKQGVGTWNTWREKHPEIQPDLGGANLSNADFSKVNLSGAYLGRTNFHRTKLAQANLSKAILKRANLTKADLTEANLTETDFGRAILTQANLSRANMTGCFIYAVSAWDVKLEKTIQLNLVITRSKQPPITVDNIEVAQFIYLLVDNPKIRDAIDAIAKKAVLILF
jgi:uncharacterized protein YjbI with pentapeptide repeats